MKTFFVSGSSDPVTRIRVARLASVLEDKGMRWYANWNWMNQFDDKEDNASDEELWERAVKDLRSAMYADVFIFLADTPVLSKGAHIEIGVRLPMGRLAGDFYIVGLPKPHYFFYKAPWIKHVATDAELLKCAF